jgi:hypothetical protein
MSTFSFPLVRLIWSGGNFFNRSAVALNKQSETPVTDLLLLVQVVPCSH